MKTALIIISGLLAGCVPSPQFSAPLPQRIIPYSGGLKVADSYGQEISFDRKQAGVETAVTKLVGTEPVSRSNKGMCQIVTWKNGLMLSFVNQDFVGWVAAPPVWAEPARSAGNTCG